MSEALNVFSAIPAQTASARPGEGLCSDQASGEVNLTPGNQLQADAIPIVRKLSDALSEQGIVYTQWKGNYKIHHCGAEGDIDLLIDRSDAARFTAVLGHLGFKQAEPPPERQVPGVFNFYWFDSVAGHFVHVHAYFQIVIGNYRIPVEKALLGSASRRKLFPVSSTELELILFVVRMALNRSMLNSVFRRIPGDRTKPSRREELRYLESHSERWRVESILQQHFPFISRTLFDECKQSLDSHYSQWKRAAVTRELKRQLKAFARRPQIIESSAWLARKLKSAIGRRIFFKGSPLKRLTNGGAIIAVIGGDGAGKTTSVGSLYEWLSGEFWAKRVHFGKPPRALLSLAAFATQKIHLSLKFMLKKAASGRTSLGNEHPEFPGYLELLRWLCTARDRYRLYVRVRRFTAKGGLVVSDRYPVPQTRLMDTPKLRYLSGSRKNHLIDLLIRAEEKYYLSFTPPDLLIVLRADPAVATSRKSDEDAVHVMARSREVWEADWHGTGAHIVDANRSKEEVLAEIKALVCSEL